MALGVKWRNFVNSAELASKARTGPGPGSCGGTRCLWLHPLPALPHPNAYFFLLPILEVFEWRKWQMAFSLPILERTNCEYFLCIHPNYVKGLGVTEYCTLRLPLYFWVSFDGFHLSRKQNWWLSGYPGATAGTFVPMRAGVMIITLIESHWRPVEPNCLPT